MWKSPKALITMSTSNKHVVSWWYTDQSHLPLCAVNLQQPRNQEKTLITLTELSRGVQIRDTQHQWGRTYLVNVWQAAASRVAGDTTSWVAGGDVGHLWVQAVGQVKSAEVGGELHIHTHNIHTDGQYQPAQPPPPLTHTNTPADCQPCVGELGACCSAPWKHLLDLFVLFSSGHMVFGCLVVLWENVVWFMWFVHKLQ